MKAKTLTIHWHEKQPIFSVDIEHQPPYRIATSGADSTIRIWRWLQPTDTDANATDDSKAATKSTECVEYLSGLIRHTKTVNCVRWSPVEPLIAAAGDEGTISIWRQQDANDTSRRSLFGADTNNAEGADGGGGDKESWHPVCMLMGAHQTGIFDLAWSPCGQYLISASDIDNAARIWHVPTRKLVHTMVEHKHFVQGVAWDPRGGYVATQSSDRSVNVYSVAQGGTGTTTTFIVSLLTKSSKLELPVVAMPKNVVDNEAPADAVMKSPRPPPSKAHPKSAKLYADDNLLSFFRRLSFSPDGALLVCPTGIWRQQDHTSSTENAVYIYARNALKRGPVAVYAGLPKPATVVCFSRHLYARRPALSSSTFDLPYRMLFAVGTHDSVYIYDTQQPEPIVQLSGLHYHHITDITWLPTDRALMMTSTDGFCSVACFDEGELGEFYVASPNAEEQPVASFVEDTALKNAAVNEESSVAMMDVC